MLSGECFLARSWFRLLSLLLEITVDVNKTPSEKVGPAAS